jgi:hypothetical protein
MRRWRVYKSSLFFMMAFEECIDISRLDGRFDLYPSSFCFRDGWSFYIKDWEDYLMVLEGE